MPSRTRSATSDAGRPGATSTNSSAPVRATVSTRRTVSASTAATSRSALSPARAPAVSLSSREAVDVEQGDRDLGLLALGAGDLQLEDAAQRAGVGQPGQRVGVRHPLGPLGALRGDRRGAERRDRRRREVSDRDQQRLLGRAHLVRAGASRTSARRRTPRRRRSRRRAAGPRRSSARRRASSAARPSDPVRSSAARWIGWSGLLTTSAAYRVDPVVRHPEREQQLEGVAVRVLGEDRAPSGRRPRPRPPRRSRRAPGPGRAPGRAPRRPRRGRPAGRRGRVGHECLVSARFPAACAGRPDPPGAPRAVFAASRHRTPQLAPDPIRRARGRRLCSAR